MKTKKTNNGYWFTVEPYVFIAFTSKEALLYNTLDGKTVEIQDSEILSILKDLFNKNNCGVVSLKYDQYRKENIKSFIKIIRDKFMGEIIEQSLSSRKPVQLIPIFCYPDSNKLINIKISNEIKENPLKYLVEIKINIEKFYSKDKLFELINSLPMHVSLHFCGNIFCTNDIEFKEIMNSQSKIFLHFSLSQITKQNFQKINNKNFNIRLSIDFPINFDLLHIALNISSKKEFIFNVLSLDDYYHSINIIKRHKLKNVKIIPVFDGNNFNFFESTVFIDRTDILSHTLSFTDIFLNKSLNI